MSKTSVETEPRRVSALSALRGFIAVRLQDVGMILLLLVFVVVARLLAPNYWSGENLRAVMLAAAIPMILAVSQLVVIIGRNFDISVGSTLGLSAMSVGMVYHAHPDLPVIAGFAIAIVIGLAVGAVNGLLVAYLNIPSIVLTLGTMSIITGITYLVAGGMQVNPDYVSEEFIDVSKTSPIGIPGIVLIATAFTCLVAAGLRWTRFGRSIYAFGSNREAAEMQGLAVRKLEISSFMVTGGAAGLAGAVYLSQYQLVNLFAGEGLGFEAITIVIVGGASILGGSGTVVGTIVAAVLISAMGNGLAVLGLSNFWQTTAFGSLLLLAVGLNAHNRRVQDNRAFVRPEVKL